METNTKIVALSDIGLRRKNNEDVAAFSQNKCGSLLVVADGMGGHRKGEVASKIASDSLMIPFIGYHRIFNARRCKKFFKKYVKKANNEIYHMSLSGAEYREMGTTLVSAIVGQKETYIFSVGDSRAYLIDIDKNIKQITQDQTYVEMLFKAGKITRAEIPNHPQKNLLINAVGINPDLTNAEEFVLPNESYKSILLCSDGLYNMVSDNEIQEIMINDSLTANDKANALVKKALEAGGVDNIAVVIFEN